MSFIGPGPDNELTSSLHKVGGQLHCMTLAITGIKRKTKNIRREKKIHVGLVGGRVYFSSSTVPTVLL